MHYITSVDGLKKEIKFLEMEQTAKEHLLKEQYNFTCERLKPVNLFASAIEGISSTPDLFDNILGTAAGLTTGYLSKRIYVGSSGNKIRKLLGYILQFGVTNVIARHPEIIKSAGQFIFRYFFHNKEKSPNQINY